MAWTEFTTHDDGALIAGRRAGDGPPVLLLHGGPGLGFDYLRDLADELAQENDVAWYQQRGQEPSAVEGPYTVAADVEDARRVLDALDWERAYVVGHSWGGHLALHVAETMPERLLGVLAVDPLGSIGDGRWPEFDEEIFRRTPEHVRARAREIDELSMAGAADDELALEGMRLVWPAYFADPERAPPMPELRIASERSGEMVPSILAELPALEAGLPEIRVPVGFVHGATEPDAARRLDRRGGADSRRVGRGGRGRRSFHVGRGARRCSRSASAPHTQLAEGQPGRAMTRTTCATSAATATMAVRDTKRLLRSRIPKMPTTASTATGSRYGSGVVHSDGSPELKKSPMPSQ